MRRQDLSNSYLIRPLRHYVARLICIKQFEAGAIALLGGSGAALNGQGAYSYALRDSLRIKSQM